MKILHLIFTDDLGGSERAVADLANTQAQTGHQVRVLIRPQRKTPNIKQWLGQGVEVAEVGRFFQRWHLQTHIKIFEPDILHTHLGQAGKLVKKLKTPAPRIATLHVGYKPKAHQHLDGLIALNPQQIEDARTQGYQGHIQYIPLVIAPQPKVTKKEVQTLRQTHNITEDFIIGSLGRFHPEKGMADLLQAFLKADLGPNVALVLVGAGEEQPKLKQLAKSHPNIYIIPPQVHTAPWYHLFNTFVSASYSETFGLTLIEAMQSGCPIISTKTIGAGTVLKNQPATLITHAQLPETLKKINTKTPHRQTYTLKSYEPKAILTQINKFYSKTQIEMLKPKV